ncbi:PadR family transcriptional regulator [Arthrobacter sp. H35-D1]|uniref:PadR family transcriptional regulator n=1 Tax=Arthrobacter sp. H35-D1 TaxID=3046202 RepID=UPI0024B8C5E7|nr:PadR family transcriptional regulator [Arthrobacter sp. H35-D1]MDJ0312890.1 PadR family transcriptional regulator [Arthrobacter sp. H35-D1]
MPSGQQLSPLAMAALGLLAERAMHPYEMYQLLMHRHEDRLLKVRPGTLYHAVGRLAGAALVETIGTTRDGNRPERTVYAILPAGRERLAANLRTLLAQPVKEYPRFTQALSEAHNLPAAEVIELLETRSETLEKELAVLEADRKLALAREAPRQYWIDVGYREHQLTAELDWLQRFCGDLDSGSLPWRDETPPVRPGI